MIEHTARECEQTLEAVHGHGWMTSGWRQEGETITCPACGQVWVHICNEAEGCYWTRYTPDGPTRRVYEVSGSIADEHGAGATKFAFRTHRDVAPEVGEEVVVVDPDHTRAWGPVEKVLELGEEGASEVVVHMVPTLGVEFEADER